MSTLKMTTLSQQPATTRSGFTLIEMVVVLSIFGLVMAMCYEILSTTLDAEKTVNDLTREGTIGQSIMTSMRRDLQSAAYYELGTRIFLGTDRGEGEEAEDEIHFMTFAPVPDPPDDAFEDWAGDITSVGYVLKRGDQDVNTLYRRVNWDTTDPDHLEGGSHYGIYDRVKGLSIRYFDGTEWVDEWNSEDQAQKVADYYTSLEGLDPDASSDDDGEEVPLMLPRAVEIELHVFLGDESGILKDAKGEFVVERHYMVVPLMVMQTLELDPNATDEDEDNEL